MSKKSIIIGVVVLISVLLIVGIIYFSFLKDLEEVGKSNTKDLTIELKENIYVSARYWGLTGDHQEIILSNNPISPKHKSYSKDKDYIFYTDEIFYKKEENNLVVYATKNLVSEPKDFDSEVQISVKEINDDIIKNYQKYGLEKITVFDK